MVALECKFPSLFLPLSSRLTEAVTVTQWFIHIYHTVQLYTEHQLMASPYINPHNGGRGNLTVLVCKSTMMWKIIENDTYLTFMHHESFKFYLRLHIPGALLACYGNDGAEKAIVLGCSRSMHKNSVASIHSYQRTSLTLYLQSVTHSCN